MDALQAIHGHLDEFLGKSSLLVSPSASLLYTAVYDYLWFQQLDDLETPFSKFSTVNIVPNPQDVSIIDAVVLKRHDQLSALASQMASIESAVLKLAAIQARLQENSARVRQSLHAHQALTSAVRRIPPEVWGEVFYHCLPNTPYMIPSNSQSPMVLTRVCRDWRAVAVSTPRLWSSLVIYLQKFICEGYYRHGCELWLTKAKSVPLSIRFFNDVIVEDPTLVSSAAHLLRPLINRCSDLWWHGPSLPTLFIPQPGTEFGSPLEHLHITTHRDSPSIYFPGPTRHLRSASLQCLNYDMQSLDRIRLPWDHLVELTMHFALFSSVLFVQLLTRCNHLNTIIVSCLSVDDIQLGALRALAPASITHHTLRRIEVKVIRAGLDAIFDTLTLPALEELDICFCYRERDAWPHASFMEMLKRSRCALKRLTVRSNKTAVSYFGEYVEAIPGLAVSTSASGMPFR